MWCVRINWHMTSHSFTLQTNLTCFSNIWNPLIALKNAILSFKWLLNAHGILCGQWLILHLKEIGHRSTYLHAYIHGATVGVASKFMFFFFPDLWPCSLLEECCSTKVCSRRQSGSRYISTKTDSHPPTLITRRHKRTTLHTFIQLIFLAAIAFNWSHSGPLPWPGADERSHSLLHYPLSFRAADNNPGRGQWKAITAPQLKKVDVGRNSAAVLCFVEEYVKLGIIIIIFFVLRDLRSSK